MLKALELVGFKSFADKTRFEFPRGITAVVGPNGSGKSNVVDAIKWVLGEQSVKSLRGKEMADVIFNGSGGRPPMAAAETTLTFDNTRGVLALDTPEVHITRRVYRSGEGEYLINRQPCRLRDIRELFSGTGVAAEAYSVIEQGKVDGMLQSSPRERRMIFEEAAGISRFKAKKIESQRRLERVDQNLLRLSDIVAEVESRLRSVRMQASKARRYKEHADRLQELRTQVGLVDWRRLTERLTELDSQIETLREERRQALETADSGDAEIVALDTALAEIGETVRRCDAQSAELRQSIASANSTIEHHRSRLADLEEELARHRSQLLAMGLRAGNVRQQLQVTVDEIREASEQQAAAQSQVAACQTTLDRVSSELSAARTGIDLARTAQTQETRNSTRLMNEAAALAAQLSSAREAKERHERRAAELAAAQQTLSAELATFEAVGQTLIATINEQTTELSDVRAQIDEWRQQLTVRHAELGQWRERHSGATERAQVLDELETRFEGIHSGVKEVILAARDSTEGPFRHIHGLVADLLRAEVTMAPVIDSALGDRAQFLVVGQDEELLSFLEMQTYRLKGRVGFMRLNAAPPADESVDLEGQPGVLGRADRFVETTPAFVGLAKRLLGRTWVVEKLTHARRLASGAGRGLNFVTLAGELLTDDGVVSVGPRQQSAGLISRRSELRALKQLITDLDTNIATASAGVLQLEQLLAAEERRVKTLAQAHAQQVEQLSEHRLRTRTVESRLTQNTEQRQALETETAAADSQETTAAAGLETARRDKQACETRLAELDSELASLVAAQAELNASLQTSEQDTTTAKVELATSEERLANLQARQRQFERDQQERERALAEIRAEIVACLRRANDSEMAILVAESEAAEWYVRDETLVGESTALLQDRDIQRQRRTSLAATVQAARATQRRIDEQLHSQELEANEVRHERGALAARIREDYGIELAELEHMLSPEEQDQRSTVEEEIAELRRKLQNLGNINLDALTEIEDLETRFNALTEQYQDLTKAKNQLEQIIGRINADSRRLFGETLETVKVHFQTLFRKLFGGGQADIVLEEGVDMLESGIEIIARPPGKEPRNISLLSGGEKTMTCVALLLAIFQYRPSPFCVLDEVDAALDEANIERFITVLQEFLAWTQFIVVTHSKKTMTCATTLYGVTMQESGISKRVAVRFEDVRENGDIDASAVAADDSADGDTQAA